MKKLLAILFLSSVLCGYAQVQKINPPSKFIGLLNVTFSGVKNGEYKYDGAPYTGFWESESGFISGYYENSIPVGLWSSYDNFGHLTATFNIIDESNFETISYSCGAVEFKVKGTYSLEESSVKLTQGSSICYDIFGDEVPLEDILKVDSTSFDGSIEKDYEYRGLSIT